MSAVVGIWKTLVNGVRAVESGTAAAVPTLPAEYDPVCSVVRQVFFPTVGNARRRLLFAAAGAETNIQGISEQIGKVLAGISGETVGVISAAPASTSASFDQKNSRVARETESSLATGVQIADRVWRIPASFLSELQAHGNDGEPSRLCDELPFRFLIFASLANQGVTPLFCRMCEGAVLVLSAGRTRRESASRAKEVLEQCGAEVLGAVLDGMEYPIPEAIYRRL